MNIQYIIQILQNKITILNTAKSQAVNIGDLEQINAIDKELLDTQNTFSQLTLLADMDQAAKAANSTAAEVVANGLGSVQNTSPTIQGPSSSAIINGYDVSAYATDPLYEQKIWTIIANIPLFNVISDIDNYIQNIAVGSPVTGDMIYRAVTKYNVDLPLTIAIMQNDSSFGTLGVGARTFNPGNVGNTGYAEQTYPSWFDGVCAVAEWLSRHRVDYSVNTNPVVTNEASVIEAVLPPTTPVVSNPVPPVSNPIPVVGQPVSEFVPTATVKPVENVVPVVTEVSNSTISEVATSSAPSATSTESVVPIITSSSTNATSTISEASSSPVLDLRNVNTSISGTTTDRSSETSGNASTTDVTASSTQAYKSSRSKKIV